MGHFAADAANPHAATGLVQFGIAGRRDESAALVGQKGRTDVAEGARQ